MKPLKSRIILVSIICLVLTTSFCFGQQGSVTINQDKKITNLLEIKKEMNKNEIDTDRYKVQIYSGNRSSAESAQREFNNSFTDWKATIQYETPNFKIWAGNFTTRLEADRALKKIKNKFSSAFIFRPKK
jgi:uncharacterized protein YpuA (DUF1002 family)